MGSISSSFFLPEKEKKPQVRQSVTLTFCLAEGGNTRHLFCSCYKAQCRLSSSSVCLCPVHRSSLSPSLDPCRALCLSLCRAPCLASRGTSHVFRLRPLLEDKVTMRLRPALAWTLGCDRRATTSGLLGWLGYHSSRVIGGQPGNHICFHIPVIRESTAVREKDNWIGGVSGLLWHKKSSRW